MYDDDTVEVGTDAATMETDPGLCRPPLPQCACDCDRSILPQTPQRAKMECVEEALVEVQVLEEV